MRNAFSRTQMLLGQQAMEILASSRVAVFGLGGVGGYVAEALCRSGVGSLDLIDDDRICLTNLNRQIIATRDTVGRPKVEVMKERVLSINPQAEVKIWECFVLPDTVDRFPFAAYSYVVDAVDTVSAKLALVTQCQRCATPIISCMGAGNRLDPTALRVADLYATRGDPLARVMRRELRKRGIPNLKVVYSTEPPVRPLADESVSCRTHCICPPGTKRKCTLRRDIPGSTAFVPAVAGMILAGEVVKDLTADTQERAE